MFSFSQNGILIKQQLTSRRLNMFMMTSGPAIDCSEENRILKAFWLMSSSIIGRQQMKYP